MLDHSSARTGISGHSDVGDPSEVQTSSTTTNPPLTVSADASKQE